MDDSLKRAIRRSFEAAAERYDEAAFLQHEVARRLDDHLDGMKIDPGMILDAGCGTGFGLSLLKARFPKARLLGLDLAHAMALHAAHGHAQAAGWRTWLSRLTPHASRLTTLCADMERLPLRKDSLDMVWSSLALQWVVEPDITFREAHRVLKPEGLFLFATFGPDTLMELRAASADLDGHQHVNRFIDMHDLGDALVHAGFSNPVMEMERITLTYEALPGLLRDLKAIGAHTVLENRRAGLMGKTEWKRLADHYERYRRDGRLPATYEVVYGHAWAGRKDRLEDGRQVIQLKIAGKRGGL
ncbi:MAG: malonyl-CoA O-methyltransferase [bacterium]|nr:MAG: malonyl-CoA O-methyltransferase [bacterium]KAF0147883.1 MAG: malonyl-CoA O-methyltransferase [bacterium]KAF0167484.1 MAG: malonyl-CoA O-methyltransferase [bacterium]TXT20980.1 MAG: malonyl-CoA O-methyltransferase [bacterium]